MVELTTITKSDDKQEPFGPEDFHAYKEALEAKDASEEDLEYCKELLEGEIEALTSTFSETEIRVYD
jgi:hypothetical protein